MDVSVILPVVNEGANLRILIPKLHALLDRDRLTHEIVVVDGGSTDGTRETVESLGAQVVPERRKVSPARSRPALPLRRAIRS